MNTWLRLSVEPGKLFQAHPALQLDRASLTGLNRSLLVVMGAETPTSQEVSACSYFSLDVSKSES